MVASFDSFDGTPCTLHDGTPGITKLEKGDRTTGYQMSAVCITPDTFEPNDSEAAATQMSVSGAGTMATIDHPGDSDWLQLVPFSQTVTHVWVANDGGLANSDDFTAALYRDGVLVATGQPGSSWGGPGVPLNYDTTADGPHDWKLHVTAGHITDYMVQAY
jgi:hypothetical protein